MSPDGKLSLIPWDYNLALGGMGGMGGMGGGMPGGSGETEESSEATSVVNSPIDDAFSGTNFFDTLLENETYHSQYEAYLQQLVSEYINGGGNALPGGEAARSVHPGAVGRDHPLHRGGPARQRRPN